MDGAKLKRTLSQRSNRSLGRKKYLARGRSNVPSVAPSTRNHPAGAAAYVEVGEGSMVPVVFQWPRSATEISVLFRAEGAEQWEEYSMCGDSAKGYRLMALLDPAVYHFKFWADGIYYQHPGCPLPDNFPDDFVVSFNLQFVCKRIRPEHVKKLMHKYAVKTWVRHAAKRGFGPKRSSDRSGGRHGLKALTQSLKKVPVAEFERQQPHQKKRIISLRRKKSKKKDERAVAATAAASGASPKPRSGSRVQPRREGPSLCEEEDIDTASSITDDEGDDDENLPRDDLLSSEGVNDAEASPPPQQQPLEDLTNDDSPGDNLNQAAKRRTLFAATIEEDDSDNGAEEKFYSDSSYYSSSEDSDATDSGSDSAGSDNEDADEKSEAEKNEDEADVTVSECDDKDDEGEAASEAETTEYEDDGDEGEEGERPNAGGKADSENKNKEKRRRRGEKALSASERREKRRTRRRDELEQREEEKEGKRQRMKRGPLVRLHPKTVLPVTFFWPGPAHSVKLIYKSYFHAKWKSKAMQPCSPSSSRWSVRITLLPGIYQTCYLIDGEHYYASLTRRVVDPQHVLSDCNLYRIDVDTKPWLEATKKRGHLIKQGGRIKTWKHRYTTLQHHEIHYFRDDKEEEPINVIPLSSVEGEIEASELAGKKRACFHLHTPGRTYVFSSASQEEIEDWVRCINRSAFMHKNWERVLAHYRPPPATYHNTRRGAALRCACGAVGGPACASPRRRSAGRRRSGFRPGRPRRPGS